MPELISRFHNKHPSTKAILRITSSRIITEKVLAGNLEFGFVWARFNEKKFIWSEIITDELPLAVHPNHTFACQNKVSLKVAIQSPFVIREPESGTRRVFAEILEKEGLRESDLKVVAEIGSTAAIKEVVMAGIGSSILSKRAVSDDLDCGKLATLSIQGQDMKRSFYLVQRKNRVLSPIAASFIDYIKNSASSHT